jgi:phosphoglycolate phosphatase
LDIAAAANHTLRAAGYPERSVEEITSFVGDGAKNLVERATGVAGDDHHAKELLGIFLDYYRAHPVEHTVVLPDVLSTLGILGELTLAVCTNKPRAITLEVLSRLALAPYFATVCAGDDTRSKKPDPAPLLKVCADLKIAPERTVIVGDGWQDVVCGRRAGARTIGVKGMGAHDELVQAAPDALIAMSDVPKRIATWQANSHVPPLGV